MRLVRLLLGVRQTGTCSAVRLSRRRLETLKLSKADFLSAFRHSGQVKVYVLLIRTWKVELLSGGRTDEALWRGLAVNHAAHARRRTAIRALLRLRQPVRSLFCSFHHFSVVGKARPTNP